MKQTPAPGSHQLFHRGDTVEFRIELPEISAGTAWLRTNIGNARIRQAEIIAHTEEGLPFRARDWRDLPMEKNADGLTYTITLPLAEVGRFEAKAFFLEDGAEEPVWAEGKGNSLVHVCAARTAGTNSIYAAFPRLFGGDHDPQLEEGIRKLEESGAMALPPSGTLRDLEAQLDHILGKLRFDILLLLPVFPTPTSFGRMGRYGSPFASLDFFSIDPALAVFDRTETPHAQFADLIEGVHRRGARLFMDVPVNHTGWASRLQNDHPDWFLRKDDGEFVSPGAWGIIWEDLIQLDFSVRELRIHIAGVFLFWCRRGVDGFRCDAGHLLPIDVWVYIIAKVRREFPDTVFLLEGLGSSPVIKGEMRDGANFDWDYSEIFQHFTRDELEHHLPRDFHSSDSVALLVHFAETHDNPRIAARGEAFARKRTALSALLSTSGAWGITCGVEWLAEEKINVHGKTSLNWGSEQNQITAIERLNALLQSHPAFQKGGTCMLVTRGKANNIALVRRSAGNAESVLILINLDAEEPTTVTWNTKDAEEFENAPCRDMLTGREVAVGAGSDDCQCTLDPGSVLVVTTSQNDIEALEAEIATPARESSFVSRQRLRALALDLGGGVNITDEALELLQSDPLAYLEAATSKSDGFPRVTCWQWPQDATRVTPLPPGHSLVIAAPQPFRIQLISAGDQILAVAESHARSGGGHFTVIPADAIEDGTLKLELTVFEEDGRSSKATAELRALSSFEPKSPLALKIDGAQACADASHALRTNGRGAMAQVRAAFGDIKSQYDCFLGANLDPKVPVDRHILFTRCRAWITCRGRSRAVDINALESFTSRPGGAAVWNFVIPLGGEFEVRLRARLRMIPGRNAIDLKFSRRNLDEGPESVNLIVRPDVEDRPNHHKTGVWEASAKTIDNGFLFPANGSNQVKIVTTLGGFIEQPEWQSDIHHPAEGERGLDDKSNLFSPGYFEAPLANGRSVTIKARVASEHGKPGPKPPKSKSGTLVDVARTAMDDFIVERDDSLTVIAGYPWFLDWGRDTLIFLRGVIAAGKDDETVRILKTFARFEENGTLPNMIRGDDASDRDTSDAPLWFLVACSDFARANPSRAKKLFASTCKGRPFLGVLRSIVTHYMEGTPNGIRMDPDSGLIFSPPHFTWMDTNYPPGTPRCGYPIEIQAMWVAGLSFLAEIDPDSRWISTAQLARESIAALYTHEDRPYLSDCLHASPGQSAAEATADDHLRCNQLFAITLGAVTDKALARRMVRACEELLVPGAIRTLADRPTEYPLPFNREGQILNDPHRPYWGQYSGPEDFTRKPAYHNGTAWTWPFPSWSEALYFAYGDPALETALAVLSTSAGLFETGSIGQLPEILDGNTPHTQKGCGAQAWGSSELYRVLSMLEGK